MLTDDRVGPAMAGSALRAWELARVLLRAGHDVRVAGAPGSTAPVPNGPEVVHRPRWAWPQVVLSPPWNLPLRAFLGRRRLVVDGATPLLAELAAMPASRLVRRRRRTARARLPLALAHADAVLAAGRAQAAWWRQRLDGAGRREAPVLNVPFGLPEVDPPAEADEIAGVPAGWAVVLWWGGVWPWLDLDTLLAARALLGDAPVAVVVPTARRPGAPAVSFDATALLERAAAHGLAPPRVVALDRWIPYAERHRILRRAAVVAVLHRPGEEAELSFRTRALDAVWAGVPLLLSEGGAVAATAQRLGWGAVAPALKPQAAAEALARLLSEPEQRRCRSAIASTRGDWSWPAVAAPLVETLPRLPATARTSLLGAALRAAFVLIGRGSG